MKAIAGSSFRGFCMNHVCFCAAAIQPELMFYLLYSIDPDQCKSEEHGKVKNASERSGGTRWA